MSQENRQERADEVQYHDEFKSIKSMYAVLIGLLLSCVLGGFSFAYILNGRVSVLEYANGQGKRFTQERFDEFRKNDMAENLETKTRLAVLEKTYNDTSKQIAEINVHLNFLVKSQKKNLGN